MYIYLSKKISIPNNPKVNCIAWNKQDGYIAVGGEGGLLKVVKLISGYENEPGSISKGLIYHSTLEMNQTLDGHSENVQVVIWNEKHQKLTTSDENGVIIVWTLYKGTWYEEMINNRKKSSVAGMAWNSEGSKICIIYEDGAVIVGSVDGNRIWGKELKGTHLSKVQWSPDGKLLLFGLKNGDVHLYDNLGNFVMPLEVLCWKIANFPTVMSSVGMDWYNGKCGHIYALCPTLAICYENGFLQLMYSETDPDPVIVETKMIATHCCWNHNGSLLAVVGRQQQKEDNISVNLIQFYNPFGEHLRTLKLPGQCVSACSWEEGSLRIAIGIDSYVYFANIRPDYKWCYFKNTLVYSSCRLQKQGVCVSFWDITNNQCHTRYVPVLIALAACGEFCVMAVQLDYDNPMGQYGLLLCNTLGTPVDAKYTEIEIKYVAMNNTFVVAASKSNYFLWPYNTPKMASHPRQFKSYIYHADYDPSGTTMVIKDYRLPTDLPEPSGRDAYDPVCCIEISERYLFLAKESGLMKQYALPQIILIHKHYLAIRPYKMSVNCNSTRLAVIDMLGNLTVFDVSEVTLPFNQDEVRLVRRDVWNICWAADTPQCLAIMEKARMYVFKGLYPEEPVPSSGHICHFENLEIQSVLLDEIMEAPEKPSKEHLFKLEVKSLRDTRQLLDKVGIKEAAQFITDNPHPRLWRLLGDSALKQLYLTIAEEAFVKCQNYAGIQFVKKLQTMTSDTIRKAAIATYFKNFDQAEKHYLEEERRDLALHLRRTLGDWFRVIQIMKFSGVAPDKVLETAYNHTADYFTHSNNWGAAIEYYEKAKNKQKMIEAYFHLQDYKSLESLMEQLDEKDPLLKDVAKVFTTEGDYTSAIRAYMKMGDIRAAIKVSVKHRLWDKAIYIAKKHNLKRVGQVFKNYSEHLIAKNKINKAIEINVQAKHWFTAAKYSSQLAENESRKPNREPIKIKRMYVYAAHLVETYKKDPNADEQVDSLADVELLENGWQGAEAYHFYTLGHQQLYNRKVHDALCTFYKLQNYAKFIPAEEVYSIIALAAYFDGQLELCSKMFIKLASLEELSEEAKDKYDQVAADVFVNMEPVNSATRMKFVLCFNCQTQIPDWESVCPKCDITFPICVGTGKSMINSQLHSKVCGTCNHSISEYYPLYKRICPLCHSCNYSLG